MTNASSPKKTVREIAANPQLTCRSSKRLRVAAYCRVSTEQEEQESSFEGQVTYYTNHVSYTHLRANETRAHGVWRLVL